MTTPTTTKKRLTERTVWQVTLKRYSSLSGQSWCEAVGPAYNTEQEALQAAGEALRDTMPTNIIRRVAVYYALVVGAVNKVTSSPVDKALKMWNDEQDHVAGDTCKVLVEPLVVLE